MPEPVSSWADDLIGKTVAQVMVTEPKTLPVTATVGEVRDVFDDDHVHMVLLVEGAILRGTVERDDLGRQPEANRRDGSALALASLQGRTLSPTTPALLAREMLLARDSRRAAVVDKHGALLGLLCLKRRLTGFCSDEDVAARAADHGRPGTPS
jgi:CBS domain containing-hemolysin-like protein